jgi:hypothetical protein
LLLHSGISGNDSRRSALYRYISNLRDAGEDGFGHLQIAAVAYLRKLDQMHDDRAARLAADRFWATVQDHTARNRTTRAEGANNMAGKTFDANRYSRDLQKRISAATAIGINALKPIMHFQASMLRMWADSIEGFVGNYGKGLEETATGGEQQSDK